MFRLVRVPFPLIGIYFTRRLYSKNFLIKVISSFFSLFSKFLRSFLLLASCFFLLFADSFFLMLTIGLFFSLNSQFFLLSFIFFLLLTLRWSFLLWIYSCELSLGSCEGGCISSEIPSFLLPTRPLPSYPIFLMISYPFPCFSTRILILLTSSWDSISSLYNHCKKSFSSVSSAKVPALTNDPSRILIGYEASCCFEFDGLPYDLGEIGRFGSEYSLGPLPLITSFSQRSIRLNKIPFT